MLFWISLMDKWSFCDEIEFLHVWTCQFDFFYIDCRGCRSESKFKTQDHRPSDHFGWLEILRLNYEYFSFSPICTRGEEKFYVCINSLISAQMIIALSIFPLFSKKFLVVNYEFARVIKWFTTFCEFYHKGCKHVWTIPRCQTLTTREKENCKWIFDEKEYWKSNELIPDL